MSVGVVCGILLVMISIFITITGVVLWSRKKKAKGNIIVNHAVYNSEWTTEPVTF